jgi:hypothetical protein
MPHSDGLEWAARRGCKHLTHPEDNEVVTQPAAAAAGYLMGRVIYCLAGPLGRDRAAIRSDLVYGIVCAAAAGCRTKLLWLRMRLCSARGLAVAVQV